MLYEKSAEAKDDSFFDKIRAGFRASQQYSPKQIKQLGTKGAVVRPKGSRTKTAMFYEKLAEAKEEKKQGLSLGQKAGVAGVGLAGAMAPALGAVYSKPTSAFNKILESGKHERKAKTLSDQFDANKAYFNSKKAPLLEEISNIDPLIDYHSGRIAGNPFERDKLDAINVRDRLKKLQKDLFQEVDLLDTERLAKQKGIADAISETRDRAFKVKRNKLLGTMGLAGVGTAFAAKKLFDRYNKRKQRED